MAGARGRARRARARPPGREEDDRGGVEMGWAGSAGQPGEWASGKRQVSGWAAGGLPGKSSALF